MGHLGHPVAVVLVPLGWLVSLLVWAALGRLGGCQGPLVVVVVPLVVVVVSRGIPLWSVFSPGH